MMPTIFPSGPDGWTTFWTAAVSVRLVSSIIVTVIRRRPGDAIAVTIRTTDKMGSGKRCFFRPQGARRKRVSVTVRIGGTPPELEARDGRAAIPSFQSRHRASDDIIIPLDRGPPSWNSVSIMRPETMHVTNQAIESEAFAPGQMARHHPAPFTAKQSYTLAETALCPHGGISWRSMITALRPSSPFQQRADPCTS